VYLKKLEMQGFKSFVDKISLDFGNGITAIVGPNGSGKSNISDAIRWVLGEQSIKTLRGSKMEDVIFAGTEKRKPTGFAEVSLTLDNSERIFDIDYNEITVTRRVYRSGESEYFINRAICRLRDIAELFMDTGLGKDGYSIIGQGKIDAIVSGKPEERRKIFEEAAGVSKFKYKKIQAEHKLAQTEDNLERVLDIAGELESRLSPLKKQSEKATQYLELRDKLTQLDINLYVEKITHLTKSLEQQREKLSFHIKELETENALYEQFQEKEAQFYSETAEVELNLSNLREALHKTQISQTELAGEISLIKNNIGDFGRRISETETEINMILGDFSGEDAKKAEIAADIEKYTAEKNRLLSEIDGISEKISDISAEVDQVNSSLQLKMQEENNKQREIDLLQGKIATIDALDQNFDERLEKLTQAANDAKARHNSAKEKYDEYEKEINDKKAHQAELLETSKKLESDAEAKKTEISQLKNEYNDLNDEYNKKMSRLNILTDMEKNLDGFAHGVKALLKSDVSKEYNIHGIYSKLIKTDEKYFTAVEVALGNAMQNIVVSTDSDAKAAIRYLKGGNHGRVTFLPVSSVKGKRGTFEGEIKSCPGYLGLVCDKIECSEQYREITESLLGQTALFDNVDNALKAAKQFNYKIKIVTLGGEALHPGGSISGGSAPKNSGLLGRESEIAKLTEVCRNLEKKMDKADDKIADFTDEIRSLLKEHEVCSENLRKTGEEILKLIGTREIQSHILSREESEMEKLSSELSLIKRAGENSASEKKQLQLQIDAKNLNREKIKADAELLRQQISDLIKKRESLNSKTVEIRVKISTQNSQIEMCNMKSENISAEHQRQEQRIKLLKFSIEEMEKRISQLQAEIKVKQQNVEENKALADKYEGEITSIISSKADSDKEISALKENIRVQNEKLNNLKIAYARMEDGISHCEQSLDDAIGKLWSEYDISFSEAQNRATEIDNIEEARKTAGTLKAQIRALGNINVEAIEEYKEVSERYEFLSKQIEDLTTSKNELTSLISDTVKSMNTRFITEFENINQHFANIFRELFGGGTAALSLTDPTNIAETGIEISVRPPGKKLQRLSLLSGGEMALTAIAILFAILKVRPTPFCILDEIEAALDDNNIQRFCNYIKNFSNTTQFIVVTHRRGTMEAADILYGVTMQEKGISKLLSMRPDEVEVEN